uniref:Uncharacterized protein n=1 Tax=viral metagenome TaxID=1070528 RepID=A0A6C0HLT6_9ZZZZ
MVLHKVKKFTKGKKLSSHKIKTKNVSRKHSNKSKTITGGGKGNGNGKSTSTSKLSRLRSWLGLKTKKKIQREPLLANSSSDNTTIHVPTLSFAKTQPSRKPNTVKKCTKCVNSKIFKNVLDVLYFLYNLESNNQTTSQSNNQSNRQKYEYSFWELYKYYNEVLTQEFTQKDFTINYVYQVKVNNDTTVLNTAKIINNNEIIKKFKINFKNNNNNNNNNNITNINIWLVDAINKFIVYCNDMKWVYDKYGDDVRRRHTNQDTPINFATFWQLNIEETVTKIMKDKPNNKKNINIEYPIYPFLNKNIFHIYQYVEKCFSINSYIDDCN